MIVSVRLFDTSKYDLLDDENLPKKIWFKMSNCSKLYAGCGLFLLTADL